MVWGVELPLNSGMFCPDGSYVGWKERLTSYFNQLPEQSQLEYDNRPVVYFSRVAHKFHFELGRKMGDNPPVGPIENHEWPNWFETEKRYSVIGSLLHLNSQVVVVDDTLRGIIERLDPGVHLFSPLRITMPKGEVYSKPFHVMVVGRFLESFVVEKSAEGSFRNSETPGYYFSRGQLKEYMSGLAMSRDAIGSAHIWRERKLLSPDLFISDALQNEISMAGLRIPKHWQLREVKS